MSDFIHNVPIKVPNKSGFDMSFENGFTGKTGQLIPVVCQELLPNDTVSLGATLQVQLPPMVSDFLGRIDFVLESFFVPSRLCWGGWQTFMTHPTSNPQYPSGQPTPTKITRVPSFRVGAGGSTYNSETFLATLGPCTLADYLGLKVSPSALSSLTPGTYSSPVSMLPFIAYHLIYDNWYRDTRLQAPLFYSVAFGTLTESQILPYLPAIGNIETSTASSPADNVFTYNLADSTVGAVTLFRFFDGSTLFDLRSRNWAKDYFTSASTQPQASLVGGKIDFTTVENEGSISIAAIRAANSLQQWLERNNLAGYRYADQIYAQFGIYPSDAIMDRPLYLGRSIHHVYTRSVFQQSPTEQSGSNPFAGNVGAKFGSSQVLGDDSIVDSFTASEHGYLFVIASLVPRAYYSSGSERKLFRVEVGDFAFPLLANMGDQSILDREVSSNLFSSSSIFGYTDLYAEYKVNIDQIHGLLRDDSTLSAFALQRSFDSTVDLGSDFLQIPTDFLDQVTTVSTEEIGATYWADIYFKFKKISTLPVYSQPTLMDLQNGHIETISRGGKRL